MNTRRIKTTTIIFIAGAMALMGYLSLLVQAQAGQPDSETAYRSAAVAFHRLRANPRTPADAWRKIALRFERIHLAGPQGPRGGQALYSAGIAAAKAWSAGGAERDLESAQNYFSAFFQQYPKSSLADDSLMQLAEMAWKSRQDAEEALRFYTLVDERYPDGDQSDRARKMLRRLSGKKSAAQEIADEPEATRQAKPQPVKKQPNRKAPEPAPEEKEKEAEVLLAAVSKSGHRSVQRIASAPSGNGGRVDEIQVWSAKEWTRVIFTTDAGIEYSQQQLKASGKYPERVFFDFKKARPAKDIPALKKVGDSVLSQVRVSRFSKDTTRVVLDLKGLKRYEIKDYMLGADRKIVVDLFPTDVILNQIRQDSAASVNPGGDEHGTGEAALNASESQAKEGPNRVAALAAKSALKVKRIMIDPGHGGHDPGANAHGIQEKELVLDISKNLKKLLLRKHPDLQVELTREKDEFLPLKERPARALEFGADLFVSVHLNANTIQRFHGVETYFLNMTSDKNALAVAARENNSTHQEASGLNAILYDLLQDANIVESSELAESLQGSLVKTLRGRHKNVKNLGVKQAPFLVLMGAQMPSVLVEAGFVTNPMESKRLKDDKYLNRISEGIYEGLRSYIEKRNIAAKSAQPDQPRLVSQSAAQLKTR